MSAVTAITTFSDDHINLYGKRFVEEFVKNSEIPLVVYAENFTKKDLPNNYSLFEFTEVIPEHLEFRNHIYKLSTDLGNIKSIRRLAKALRWSYKSFTIIHALKNIEADYILWLDGDVVTKSTVTHEHIKNLCNNKLLMAYKETLYGQLHIESGLVIYNKKHKMSDKIIKCYEDGYLNKKILELKKPWDGFLLGSFVESKDIVNECILHNPPFKNVANLFYHDVGKNKFLTTDLNRYSGRKSLI